MNYSKTAERVWEMARGGIVATVLYRELGDVHRTVYRLVEAGLLRKYPFPTGTRGRNTHLLFSQGEAPKKKVEVKKPRPAPPAPFRDLILSTISDKEMTLRQVADIIGRPTYRVSSQLKKLCASGVLVRRRSLGEIEGMTSKSDVFLYRVSG